MPDISVFRQLGTAQKALGSILESASDEAPAGEKKKPSKLLLAALRIKKAKREKSE